MDNSQDQEVHGVQGTITVVVSDGPLQGDAMAMEVIKPTGNTVLVISKTLMKRLFELSGKEHEPELVAISIFETSEREITEEQKNGLLLNMAKRKNQVN